MKPAIDEVSKANRVDRRVDGPAEQIDDAVVLASIDGVGPAIEYMSAVGIEQKTALRVLTSPMYHRKVGIEAMARVLHYLSARPKKFRL